jgi:hypothetical protein
VAFGPEFPQRKEEVQRSDDIVDLSEHRMFTVDHRIGSRALFGKVNHGVRLEALDHTGQEVIVVHVADKLLDGLSGEFLPDAQAVREGLNRRQALRA